VLNPHGVDAFLDASAKAANARPAMPSPIKRQPAGRGGMTAERLFNRLVESVVSGTIPSGVPFREAYFASRWGASRTPMREAVRRAAETGFIVLRPNRPPLIRSFTPEEIYSLYELRELLETFALKRAFSRIPAGCIRELKVLSVASERENSAQWVEDCLEFDRRLHLAWSENCQNPWLTESLGRIWNFIRILQRYMAKDVRLVRDSAREHRLILKAIAGGNRRGASRFLAQHIRDSGKAVITAVQRRGENLPRR
jgi:DNA-binding GntR family transcriptional regulator